jgi:AIPR protein
MQSLFYDNVRDFQDYNEVNKEIRATLQSEGKDRFAVMNNGVTLVAKSLQAVGNRFIVEDYQIVNGCQTSHVLYDNEGLVGDQVYVPLKVIVTADEEITNSIITAANRQTQVKRDQLFALSDVQKKLEDYFESYRDKQRLYYERRSKQYAHVNGVEKVRIVTAPQQIRAFASMFLDEPHRASRYYSELLSLVGDRIFGHQHRLEPYYTSAYALYKLEFLFRNGQLDQRYRPARYHLLMTLRHQVGGEELPLMTANKMDEYCEKILKVLWDDDAAVASFTQACQAVERITGAGSIDRDRVKTQTFTEAVLVQARKA